MRWFRTEYKEQGKLKGDLGWVLVKKGVIMAWLGLDRLI